MITISIPSWNRDSMTVDAFRYVYNDERISEIVIVDDCSDERIFANLQFMVKGMQKVKLFRNENNLDCYRNKREAVSKATNEWVILLDSDNVIKKDYLDALFRGEDPNEEGFTGWPSWTIMQPSFARPHFDFRKFQGMNTFSKETLSQFIDDTTFQTMLNAMNFFVNRDEYLKVWDGSIDPVTSDSLYFNYCWLKAGNSIYVVPGMEYEHLVHDGSHYRTNVHRTPRGFHEDILNKLRQL